MLEQYFSGVFGDAPTLIQQSPGRVNLIGEHVDYNGGWVLPTATPLGLTIAMRPRSDARIRVKSAQFEGVAEGTLASAPTTDWSGHAIGAVIYAVENGLMVGGADICIESNLPYGAGLSSSAALVVGVLKAARSFGRSDMSNEHIALIARRVENDFIGVPCGIMDQMAVAVSHPGQALALDTNTLDYQLLDLPTTHQFAVVHSGVRRQLTDGRYRERKEECDRAKAYFGTENLCLLDAADLSAASGIPNSIVKRVRHCITEHKRTIRAVLALGSGDIGTFGSLMNESHTSMRNDFQMSVPEIDELVDDAVRFGALGARLTGGGFGGCIVACVPNDRLEDWKAALMSKHPKAEYLC